MAQPTVTSNFAGKAAGFYISAALRQANSLENLTVMENVKYKSNIQRIEGASLVADATCDFTAAGTLTMTEKVLETKLLQVNLERTFIVLGSFRDESRSRRSNATIF